MTSAGESFLPGQRWMSESEPELGLGTVLETGFRDVRIRFEAAGETRIYMRRSAPLRRVRMQAGDRTLDREGKSFQILRVEERGGLLFYYGEGGVLPEGDLQDRQAFSDPDKRLLAGKIGTPRAFSLRRRTQEIRHRMLGDPARGLAGARMELLSHQISIAHEVASRHRPRVLLCDEVGLGKTIEAGLVFHRLQVTGQIRRVLVAAPPQLVHQWMVELWRRFHHMFTVLDEEFCRAEEKGDSSKNPFALRQHILCSTEFLASPKRSEQATAAGVDLLIVDEAHHLGWSLQQASPEYLAVEKLAKESDGVLLLTATPIQLGQEGHFGRLRLLDPGRFNNFQAYLEETRHYGELAGWVDMLLASNTPNPAVAEGLRKAFPDDAPLHARLAEYLAESPEARARLLADLIDRHGTGRLMFRNRRQAMGGFPKRIAHPIPLEPAPEDGNSAGDPVEQMSRIWKGDPRLLWLVEFLKQNPGEKILLLCAHKNTVLGMQDILPSLTTASFVSFHENLTMNTRDKNAAWFAEKDGAQMLICSEIGSEGRNFQFARHLVLFDLPLNPSVLEQRIGRLDRIGQKSDIHLHIPFPRGSAHEIIFRWYHEGFNAFQIPLLGADYFHETLSEILLKTCRSGGAVESLIAATRTAANEVRESLERGRDRLLELNSNRPEVSRNLIDAIRAGEADPSLEKYLEEVFDHFGLDSRETALQRGYFIFPGERMLVDAFPGIPEQGLALTYDRSEALIHENVAYISPDHSLVQTAVDMVLEDPEGTTGFVAWPQSPRRGMALEAVYMLEASAPGKLHLDRFLPPAPIRILVDQEGRSLDSLVSLFENAVLEAVPTGLLENPEIQEMIPKLLAAAAIQAARLARDQKSRAQKEASERLLSEFSRLRDLRALNSSVSPTEVDEAERHARDISIRIAETGLRLDAVRLILLGKSSF